MHYFNTNLNIMANVSWFIVSANHYLILTRRSLFKHNFWPILVILKYLTLFSLKVGEINLEKRRKLVLLDNFWSLSWCQTKVLKLFQVCFTRFLRQKMWILTWISLLLGNSVVTKCRKFKRKLCRQFFAYFENVCCFNKVSFYQKWSNPRLLFINMVYASCHTS